VIILYISSEWGCFDAALVTALLPAAMTPPQLLLLLLLLLPQFMMMTMMMTTMLPSWEFSRRRHVRRAPAADD